MKDLKNLKGAKELGRKVQKSIRGGQPLPPADCECFCYSNNQQYPHSCFTFCPDGSIPGLISGGPECAPVVDPQP